MNKIYIQPEIEIVLFEEEDIMTASNIFDPDGIFGDDNKADSWFDQ